MKKKISALLLGTALTLATGSLALAQDKTVKIGALSDQSGLYADLGGPGSTLGITRISPTSARRSRGSGSMSTRSTSSSTCRIPASHSP
jgi:branched-chain amino acid transport system substrate-binding protein